MKKILTTFKSYLFIFLLSLVFGISLMRFGASHQILFLLLSGVLFLLLISNIYYIYQKNNTKLEHIFLLVAIPISTLFCLFLAPYRVMDETAHIVKTLDVSYGNLITAKDEDKKTIIYVPSGVNEKDESLIHNFSSLEKELNRKTDYEYLVRMNPFFGYTAINNPTNYMVPAIGFKLGNILDLNIYVSMYIGKFLNTFLYLVVGYFIMKFFPFGKLFMLVYLVNPMLLQTATSITADAFTNLVCLFWISYILYLRYQKQKIENIDIVVLITTMLLLSTAKFIYFPLLLLLLLIRKLFDNKKQKTVIIISVILSLLVTIACIYIGLGYSNEFQKIMSGNHDIDAIKQIKNIVLSPWNFIIGIVHSLYSDGMKYIYGFFGRDLCSYNTTISLAYFMYVLLFIGSIFLEKVNIKERWEKILIIAISIILFFCIFGVEYLTWNGIGSRIVDGVQGRYFIPFMVLPLLLLNTDKIKINFKHKKEIVIAGIFLVHFLSISILFVSYL